MTVEELQILITANTNGLRKEISQTQNSLTSMEKTADSTNKGVMKSFKWLKTGIIALGIGKIISSIMGGLSGAVNRFDSLNNYANVMSNLGVGADDANSSIKRLTEQLKGLPTTLDDAALSVQRFTSSNGNIQASTEFFLSLNNAILAGNAPIESQRSALEQLSQAYAKGKPDMMEWRTAMQAMPAQLKQVALAMGFVSADALGESLRSGETSMNDFMLALVKLNKEGVDGFKSFEEQARNSTGGVTTSITNVKTTIQRGIADIMQVIGRANIAGFFNGIAKAIDAVVPYIAAFVKITMMAVSAISRLFGGTKKSADSVSASASKATSSLGGIGKTATSGLDAATGSAKKLNKELGKVAGFDDLYVMDSGSNDSGSSGADVAGAGLGDLSGLDFNWGEKFDGVDKVSEKVEQLLGHVQKLGDFFDKYKVPIITTLAAIAAGFATIKIAGFVTGIANATTGVGAFINAAMNWGLLKTIWAGIVTTASSLLVPIVAIVGVVMAVTGAIAQLWQTNEDFRNNVITAWNGIKDTLQNIWNTVLSPVFDSIKSMLFNIWDLGVKPLWEGWVDFVASVVAAMSNLWTNTLKPLVDWFINYFMPPLVDIFHVLSGVVSFVMSTIGIVIGNAFKNIGVYIEGVIKVFQGIITFLTGVFTGDWKKAWEGVKQIFSSIVGTFKDVFKNTWDAIVKIFSAGGKIFDGIKDGIANVFRTIVNSLISGINRIIAVPFNVINGTLNKVRSISILGAKPFSGLWGENPIGVPQIPKLPAYEKGTNYVPEDGWAFLHKGEEVKPAKQGKPYENNDGDLLELLDLIAEQNALLRMLYEKDSDVYLDEAKVTNVQNKKRSRRMRALGFQP